MENFSKISKRTIYISSAALLIILFGVFSKLVPLTHTAFITISLVVAFLVIVLDTFKKTARFVLLIIGVFFFLLIAIQTSFVQNWATGIATKKLSKALGTEVRIKNISFSLFDKVNLEGTLIRDKQKDTLLYADQLRVRITDWFFLKKEADLKFFLKRTQRRMICTNLQLLFT